MCGRLHIRQAPLSKVVEDELGVELPTQDNQEVRPTQEVASLIAAPSHMMAASMRWGIKPNWAKRLLINAQAETVAIKPTFRQQFYQQRCVIPCSGWFEWSSRGGITAKYLFSAAESEALYMAGIYYLYSERTAQFVTLTTSPDAQCRPFHHRMPLLLRREFIAAWLHKEPKQIGSLLMAPDISLNIERAA